MDPSYETVVDLSDLIWTLVVYLLHGAILFFHVSLACFLIGTGAHKALRPDADTRWLRRLGATGFGSPSAKLMGSIRIVLGLALFAPFAFGVSATIRSATL